MSDRNLSKEMREACRTMGYELHSTDRFVHTAIWWLTKHVGPVTIEQIPEYDGSTSWIVRSDRFHAGDESLSWALVAAIKCFEPCSESA